MWRRLSAEELMLLSCAVGEDSWESLGLQGDPTSPFWRRSVLDVHWKDWCWSSNTLATDAKEPSHWKRPWCWERLGQDEKGITEDEMIGWHHWLSGHEFEQTPEDSEGEGSQNQTRLSTEQQQQIVSWCWRLEVSTSTWCSAIWGSLCPNFHFLLAQQSYWIRTHLMTSF